LRFAADGLFSNRPSRSIAPAAWSCGCPLNSLCCTADLPGCACHSC